MIKCKIEGGDGDINLQGGVTDVMGEMALMAEYIITSLAKNEADYKRLKFSFITTLNLLEYNYEGKNATIIKTPVKEEDN